MQKQLIESTLLSYRARSHSFSYETSNTEGVTGGAVYQNTFFNFFKIFLTMKKTFFAAFFMLFSITFTTLSAQSKQKISTMTVASAQQKEASSRNHRRLARHRTRHRA